MIPILVSPIGPGRRRVQSSPAWYKCRKEHLRCTEIWCCHVVFSRHTHQKWFSYFNHQVLKHPSCCSRYPTLDLGTIVSCVRRTNELFPIHPPPYVHNHVDAHPVSLGVVAFSSPKSPDLFSFTSGGCSAHELNSSPLSQSF